MCSDQAHNLQAMSLQAGTLHGVLHVGNLPARSQLPKSTFGSTPEVNYRSRWWQLLKRKSRRFPTCSTKHNNRLVVKMETRSWGALEGGFNAHPAGPATPARPAGSATLRVWIQQHVFEKRGGSNPTLESRGCGSVAKPRPP